MDSAFGPLNITPQSLAEEAGKFQRKLEAGMSEEDTRFFGLKRECGLHESWDAGYAPTSQAA